MSRDTVGSEMSASERPPAVLIINPNAGRMPQKERAAVVESLSQRFRLEVLATTEREDGIALATEAADAGAGLVIAYGGDGHVNEVVNGIAGSATALGIIPGGTMNVLARALGIPLDPLAAIEHLVARLGGEPRLLSLGQMDGRYFTSSAGCGFDAEAAERVEEYLNSKRRFGQMYFFWSAFRVLAGTYRHRNPSMMLRGEFGDVPVAMAIACKAGPYAYFAGRPIDLTPKVSLDAGLDVFALKRMRIEALPFYVLRVLADRVPSHGDAFYAHDLDKFEVTAEEPFSRHVDGEPLGRASSAAFTFVRDVLKVRA
jgi:Sphingosine kinase and enzymes related to eukaryotic diacylglycerol kinase